MFADQTLTPREAVRLCALGTIAAGPSRYSELAVAVRTFLSRISGPSLDLLAPSFELLRYEGLIEPIGGRGMEDDALMRITESGRSEFRRLLTARTRPSSDLSKLVTALKFRFLHLLDDGERARLTDHLAATCESEVNRLLDLRDRLGCHEGSYFRAWLDLEIVQAEARQAWTESLARTASLAPTAGGMADEAGGAQGCSTERNRPAMTRPDRRLPATTIALMLITVLWPGIARAAFDLPLRCTVGTDCWVSKYMDHDPATAEMRDFACGRLADDGHKGTDFAIGDETRIKAGVTVVAAAAGVVARARDGDPDVSVRVRGMDAVRGRECGNTVAIRHRDGWVSNYCHLRQGSVAVTVGQTVAVGDAIGQVGLSGATEYAHLHFEVYRGKTLIDPFLGDAAAPSACARPSASSTGAAHAAPTVAKIASGVMQASESGPGVWTTAARSALAYRPVALFTAGFAAVPPTIEAVRNGTAKVASVSPTAESIYGFTEIFGLMTGDTVVVRFTPPTGRPLESTEVIDKSVLQWLRTRNFTRKGPRWAAGRYRLDVSVTRPGSPSGPVTAAAEMTIPAAGKGGAP